GDPYHSRRPPVMDQGKYRQILGNGVLDTIVGLLQRKCDCYSGRREPVSGF
ncbi:hypothetical protein HAX54_005013, partial [Datura stramonium]|nr:hypothetical protein [Datura stramonium]